MNARRAPEGIGEGHGADELGDLRIDGRTTVRPRREFQFQNARKPCRCQRITVCG